MMPNERPSLRLCTGPKMGEGNTMPIMGWLMRFRVGRLWVKAQEETFRGGRGKSLLMWAAAGDLVSSLDSLTLFFDACLLTGELAKVVELGAAHLTNLVHFDALNVRRLDGEDTLNAHSA